MTEYEFWNLLMQGVGVAAAIFVILLAIWGDWIRQQLAPPRLKVQLRSPKSQVELIGEKKTKTRYWHLEVSNANSWNPATGVKVFVTKIERKTQQGWGDPYEIGPIPLKWQFPDYYGKSPFTFGPPRFCDLGCLE